MKLETDLNKIAKLAKKKNAENLEFRKFLKMYNNPSKKLDLIVHELYLEISAKIDCKTCANCCRKAWPILKQKDINEFLNGLKVPLAEFKKDFLIKDNDEPGGFKFNKLPCPFLKDNLCSNYEFRPGDCKSYPHLHKKDFVFRLWGVIDNCFICPIVFNVYENLKEQLWRNDYKKFII